MGRADGWNVGFVGRLLRVRWSVWFGILQIDQSGFGRPEAALGVELRKARLVVNVQPFDTVGPGETNGVRDEVAADALQYSVRKLYVSGTTRGSRRK